MFASSVGLSGCACADATREVNWVLGLGNERNGAASAPFQTFLVRKRSYCGSSASSAGFVHTFSFPFVQDVHLSERVARVCQFVVSCRLNGEL